MQRRLRLAPSLSLSLLTSLHHDVPPRRRIFRLAIAHMDSPGVASLASSSATARSAVRRAGQGRPPPSSTAVTPGLRCVLAANGFLSGRGLHNAVRPRPAYLPWPLSAGRRTTQIVGRSWDCCVCPLHLMPLQVREGFCLHLPPLPSHAFARRWQGTRRQRAVDRKRMVRVISPRLLF